MKKIVLMTAVLVATASLAFAGSATITGTKHNLSKTSGNTFRSTVQDQICVFCHTPHNALKAVPLWNRSNPAGSAFTLYTSSPTLDFKGKTVGSPNGLAADSVSLFCMSCHDGATSLGAYGTTKEPAGNFNVTDKITGNANLGTGLGDDHPISFKYSESTSDTTIKASPTAKGVAVPFFKAGGQTGIMECSSCHAVHDNTEEPFLRTTRANSAICYACHNK